MQQIEASDSQFYLETLRQIVSIPTAPFHEEGVGQAIMAFLRRYDIPFELDRYGNIIAHYQRGPAYQPMALMAHTDHPAFELEAPLTEPHPDYPQANWTARLLGGVTEEHFKQPAPVYVFAGNDSEQRRTATLLGGEKVDGPRQIRLYLQVEDSTGLESGNFGIWGLTDFELQDDFIHARVMDDLVGCVAALLTLWKLSQAQTETNVYAVFTRAEEVGLVGAELIFKEKRLPADTYLVSLEASRALPGAEQGLGPVIRVGDRGFTFSEEAEFVLKQAATRLEKEYLPPLKVQRQLMSGGRCEASTAVLQGYLATGLAFPLGNYHNMGRESRLEAEYIHRQDFLNGVVLLQEAAALLPRLPQLRQAQLAAETTGQRLIDRLVATREAYN